MNAFARLAQRPADLPAKVIDPHEEVPDPPIPPDIDLAAWPKIMLGVLPGLRNRLFVTGRHLAFGVQHALTLIAFHEKPAGSLPNDDEWLAGMLGFGGASLPVWESVRADVLAEWVLCADGRLYHPTAVEAVSDIMQRRGDDRAAAQPGKQRTRAPAPTKEAERQRRYRARRKAGKAAGESTAKTSADGECEAGDARDGGVTSVTVGSVTRDVTSPLKGKGKEKIKPSPQSPPAGGDDGRGVENPSGSGLADGLAPPDPETLPAPKTRIPEGWQPSADDRAFAAELGLSAQRVEAETARFVDYWLSQGTCRACWSRTWRNRIRDYAERTGLTENGMPKANAASPPDRDDRPPGPGAGDPQWHAIAEAFRRLDRRGEEDWRSWLRPLGFQGIEGGTLVLTGQSRFAADKVRQLLGDRLRDAALAAGVEIDDVEVVVGQSRAQSPPVPIAAAAMANQSPPAQVAA